MTPATRGWEGGRRRLRLLQEALLRGVVAGQIGRQDLDRHLAVQPWVMRRIHHPHPPAAELGANLVRTEGGAGTEGHGIATWRSRRGSWAV